MNYSGSFQLNRRKTVKQRPVSREMEEGGEDEHQQREEMAEAYRKMLMELESDDEEDKGSVPVKTEKDEVDSKPPKKVKGADDKLPLLNESLSSSLGIALADRHGTPPPPSIIVIEDNSDVKINVEPKQYEQKVPTDERKNSIPGGGGGGGRTSPNGRTSPLRNNRVEPINEKQTPHEIHANKNNNIHSLLTDNTQAFEKSHRTSNGKVSTPDSGVDSLGSEKRSSVKTISDSSEKSRKSSRANQVFMRTFKQRASQENFALYGLLTPALVLVPKIDGNDALTETFTELKGEDRELKLSAAHIDDAISGRGKYGKARAFFKSKQGRWCFKIINNRYSKYLVLFMATIHLILTFFEPPSSMSTSPAVFALTPLCILVYAADVGVHMGFLSWPVFWSLDENRWIRREFIFTCMYTIDYLMLVTETLVGLRLAQPFRCLRAAIILCKLNNVQHIWDVVMSIVIKLGKVFVIIFVFITLFSAIGVHLYTDTYHDIESEASNCTGNSTNVYVGAFDHVGITSLRLFVLLSTENYPDLMIPAYRTSHWNFLYFGIFLFVGVFFLTAIILAIIVDSYWSFAKKHVKKERARERAELAKAWNLLDPLGQGSLPKDDGRFLKLLRILKPHHTEEMNLQLIDYLDHNDDGQIDSLQWTIRLNEALSFEFEEDRFYDMDTNSSKCVYAIQSFSQKIIRSSVYSKILLALILLHSILFCLRWHNMDETARITIQVLKTTILAIFAVEVLLRIMSEGKNLMQVVEILDIILIVIGVTSNIPIYFIPRTYFGLCNIISGLAVSFRLGFNSAQAKKVVILFSTKVFPVMFDLIILVFIIIFFASVLGWELFYGITADTSYDTGVYDYNCGIGFNSFSCSLLMVFQIVTTSNWHEIMNAAMVATTDWACIYFVACFTTINLVVMNLFVAIAIEAFNKLGTDKETEKEESPEKNSNQEESFAGSAMTFFNNLFESSRTEQEKEKLSQRPTGSPRMRRPSRVSVTTTFGAFPGSPPNLLEVPQIPRIPVIQEEEDEPEEDLSGLSREERKKRQMKKRREKRKNKVKTMILVMTAFRATKDSELNLNVGEEIEVVGKQDEWWEGRKDSDEQGWFPASHVKAIIRSQPPPVPTPLAQRPHMARRATQESIKEGWSETDYFPLNTTLNSTQDKLMSTAGSITSTDSTTKRPRLKLKNTSGGNWRKEILGDITVMNPQELKDLNKILKSQHTMKSKSQSLGSNLRRQAAISESIEEESEPTSSRSIPPPPIISVQHAPAIPQIIEEEEEPEEPDRDTLTVEKPALPKELKKKRNKEQTKNGEMPSWATKFLQSNNIKASGDLGMDEAKSGSSDETEKAATAEEQV
ncbi:uncharacterized protein LOC115929441 isoform X2 [Strongylocentrotus purpuratus]|uniref:SH3 domain-containing protein n=1 Tax=Strongylocentrotus purpuratus TaxID=7668 RepID=A0A7M7PN30_STRPU|nr:uncharacterized protein LOC115929441 isoform X2 [Strongylocentrotus purpuratus]